MTNHKWIYIYSDTKNRKLVESHEPFEENEMKELGLVFIAYRLGGAE